MSQSPPPPYSPPSRPPPPYSQPQPQPQPQQPPQQLQPHHAIFQQQPQPQRQPQPQQPGPSPALQPPGGMFVLHQQGQQPQFHPQYTGLPPVGGMGAGGPQPMYVIPAPQLDTLAHHPTAHQQGPVYVVLQQPAANQSLSGSSTMLMQQGPPLVPPPSPAWGQLPHHSLGSSGTIPLMAMHPGVPQPQPLSSSLGGRPVMMNADQVPSPGGSLSRSLGHSTTSMRPLPDVKVWGFALADAYHPSLQRVPVPPSVVQPTKGVATYNNDVSSSSTMPCASTVCLKYSGAHTTSGCPLGSNCPNFHVDLAYMERARRTSEPLCCGIHNDYFSQEMFAANRAPHITAARFTLVLEDRAEIELLPSQLAFTVGLEHLSTRGAVRVINMRKHICRLHIEGKCKWTKDCGHVHLCRELHALLQRVHFPSLIFLLVTEANVASIEAKLREGPALLDFFRSKASAPLVQHLVDAQKKAALEAIIACDARLLQAHWDAAMALGVTVPHPLPPERVLTPVAVPIARASDEKQLRQGSDEKPAADADLSMPTFSPGASLTNHPH